MSQVGSFNPYDTVQAETICFSKGVRTEVCKDISGKMDVDSIHNDDYIKVKGVDFKNGGPKLFEARVASGASGGSIELYIDSINGTKIGTCTFQGTNGWQNWVTKTCEVNDISGKHDLFFKFTGGNGLLFNFNWWKFTPATGTGAIAGNCFSNNSKIKLSVEKTSKNVRLDFSNFTSDHNVHINIFDFKGCLVKSIENNKSRSPVMTISFNNRKIQTGVYLIRVSQNNKTVFSQQFNLY
ncbi:MAG TPA: carbohydrate-binding protein [Chitinispirillaceae bacterium]|nr:carbohydrate-binding protein [Chitinispirillaceae bacterium]